MSKSLCNFQIDVQGVRAMGRQGIYWMFSIGLSRSPAHPVCHEADPYGYTNRPLIPDSDWIQRWGGPVGDQEGRISEANVFISLVPACPFTTPLGVRHHSSPSPFSLQMVMVSSYH